MACRPWMMQSCVLSSCNDGTLRSTHFDRNEDPDIVSLHEQRNRLARVLRGALKLLGVLERRAVRRQDDVAGAYACFRRGAGDVLDHEPALDLRFLAFLRREAANGHAELL